MTLEAWEDKISKHVTGAQLSSELTSSPFAFFSLMVDALPFHLLPFCPWPPSGAFCWVPFLNKSFLSPGAGLP